jgi:hypothetical protein
MTTHLPSGENIPAMNLLLTWRCLTHGHPAASCRRSARPCPVRIGQVVDEDTICRLSGENVA